MRGNGYLIDCLLGFHPDVMGQIYINDNALTAANIQQWQRHIAWIPQKATLFYDTIGANIKLAKPSATQHELESAAKQAGIFDFINALPNVFDTHLGEQGEGLSGGQKQRIALARAFLKHAPILALDEPTAHLDSQTESAIQDAIKHYAKTDLVLVIAHRLNTIKHADNIVVMDAGRIIEQGSYEELVSKNGFFSHLLNVAEYGVRND